MATTVDIGVACASTQSPRWWVPIMTEFLRMVRNGKDILIGDIFAISSALPDHNKNNIISQKKRLELTDSNRQAISKRFMEGKADWLFQIDDDTVPPAGAIEQLVKAGREIIGGVYFLPGTPHNPIAYRRDNDGLYHPIWDFPEGALIQVDSIGMGCTLIHRSVFEKIQKEHTVFQRPDGTLYPVHKSAIRNLKPHRKNAATTIRDGELHMPVTVMADDDNRPWPFFAMEYGRTEDHYFCELAANVGIRPWLDTNVRCDHFKMMGKNFEDYKNSLAKGEHP